MDETINIIIGYTNIKYLGVVTFVKQIINKYNCNKHIMVKSEYE